MNPVLRKNVVFRTALCAFLPLASVAYGENQGQPPEGMPFKYGQGYEKYQNSCAQCHGTDLDGTDEGPSLLHGYYKPSHHSDFAFFRAIEQGTPQHHWNFGDMKPVEGVDKQEAGAIVKFVRWFQRGSGLY